MDIYFKNPKKKYILYYLFIYKLIYKQSIFMNNHNKMNI